MNKISVIGSGGFAKEVLCLLSDLNLEHLVRGFFEPDITWKANTILGLPVLPYSDLNSTDQLIMGIGDSLVREKVYNELGSGFMYPTFIHPSVVRSKWINVDIGGVITAGSILTADINIGAFSQLNLQTTIGHDCNIGSFFTSAPSVNISGHCTIEEHVYFGTGAATKQGVSICGNVTVGMGAMVTKDIVESGIYIGLPAKKK